ncbi:MAG: hypothetical protein WBD02_10065 [Acidimicrobiia bacterium]
MKLPNLDDPTVGKFLQVATHELPTEQPSTSDRDEREFIRMRGDILNRPGLRGADGSLWAGAAIAILDNIGGFTAGLASLPDGWVVTTNLRYRRLCGFTGERATTAANVLRRGRRAVVTKIAFEADGQIFGDGVLTSAVLSPESGLPTWDRPIAMEPTPLSPEESSQHFLEWIGLEAVGASGPMLEGRVHLEQKHRNPWGIAHGGVGPAAVVGLIEAANADMTIVDAALHYLAPVRSEHMTVTAIVLNATAATTLYEVNILDADAGNRRCITGTMLAATS